MKIISCNLNQRKCMNNKVYLKYQYSKWSKIKQNNSGAVNVDKRRKDKI